MYSFFMICMMLCASASIFAGPCLSKGCKTIPADVSQSAEEERDFSEYDISSEDVFAQSVDTLAKTVRILRPLEPINCPKNYIDHENKNFDQSKNNSLMEVVVQQTEMESMLSTHFQRPGSLDDETWKRIPPTAKTFLLERLNGDNNKNGEA